MNALEGYEVSSKPSGVRRASKRNCRGKVEEFLASGNECMAKRFADDGEAWREYYALKNFVRRSGSPVIVSKRNDTVILVSEDPE